ncbi:hypothetical protein [Shewanella litorisediminis]|uniref:Uncharacterized protein n=2 Tax=Shewanella litorisediminis TaxID=1173586 RepID=A0ABX7G0I2_9GAMM|nr:hypothetical protein [Shewanella litorisediminis]QRH00809.1 hypothetical protein JQC75_13095 [Shewanella litorisediminis]
MFIGYLVVAAIIVKTSLMGLGGMSLAIASVAYLLNRLWMRSRARPFRGKQVSNQAQTSVLGSKFAQLCLTAALLHLAVYLGLVVKLLMMDGLEDIPAFLLSHLVLHHVLCALIGGIVTLMAIRLYLARREPPSLPRIG